MLKNIFSPTVFVTVVLLMLAMLVAPRALASPSAATFTVDSTLDEPDADINDGKCSSKPSGKCTLRAAVMQANVVNVDTTILLPSGIYSLTIPPVGPNGPETGDLNLTTPASGKPVISISGAGASTTIIDANLATDRVLTVEAGRPAIITGITLRGGWVTGANGGGIYNQGTLTIDNSTISGNQVVPSGKGAGGGIYNLGSLTLTNSMIGPNNTATSGGGLFNVGNLTVDRSTVYGNSVVKWGGGIYNHPSGTLIVINSTLSQNNAASPGDGGGVYNEGTANVYNTSIVFNSADTDPNSSNAAGGVFNSIGGIFNLRNTLLAGNYATNSFTDADCKGTVRSYGRNLFGTQTPCNVITQTGSWTALNSLNFIGPLQNNGGPTLTHALLPGSNAIDGGDPVNGCIGANSLLLPTDQRGAARPYPAGGLCDIGAYERGAFLYLPLIVR